MSSSWKPSANAYFSSACEEGLRLASVMRVLVHDTFNQKTGKPVSISLMTQLTTTLSTPRTDLADWRELSTLARDQVSTDDEPV